MLDDYNIDNRNYFRLSDDVGDTDVNLHQKYRKFKFFSEIQRFEDFPVTLYHLLNVYVLLQSLIISTFFLFEKQLLPDPLLIALLFFSDTSESKIVISTLVVCFLNTVIILSILFSYYSFMRNKSFTVIGYKTLAFTINLTLVILAKPLVVNLSVNVYNFFTTRKVIFLVMWIICMVLYIPIALLRFLNGLLGSKTLFYSPNPLQCLDEYVIIVFNFSEDLTIILTFISRLFGDYFRYLVTIFYILCLCFILYRSFKVPFTVFLASSFFSSIVTVCMINSILFYLDFSTVFVRFFVISLCSIAFFTIIYYLAFRYYGLYVLDHCKFETVGQCMSYMRLCLHLSDIHSKIPKIFDKLKDNEMDYTSRLELCKYCLYVCDLNKNFKTQLSLIKEPDSMPIHYRYLYYQLRVIEMDSTSNHQSGNIAELKQCTQLMSNVLRKLWMDLGDEKTNVSPTLIKQISYYASLYNEQWNDFLRSYPNNSIAADEYANYLIECGSFYSEASEWLFKSIHLLENRRFDFDYHIVSFMRTFPHQAERIIKSTKLGNFEELNEILKEKLLSEKILYPRLRLNFEQTIRSSKLRSLVILRFLIYFKLLCFSITWFVFLAYIYDSFSDRVENTYLIYNSAKLAENMIGVAISLILYPVQLTTNVSFSQIESAYTEYYETKPFINFSSSYDLTIQYFSIQSLSLFSSLITSITKRESLKTNPITKELLKKNIDLYIYTGEGNLTGTIRANIRESSFYYLQSALSLASLGLNTSWLTNKGGFTEMIHNGISIGMSVPDLAVSFVSFDSMTADNHYNSIFFILVTLFTISLFFTISFFTSSLIIIPYCIRKILNTMKTLSHDTIELASKTLLIFNEETQISATAGISKMPKKSYHCMIITSINLFFTALFLSLVISLYIVSNSCKKDFSEAMNLLYHMTSYKYSSLFLVANMIGYPFLNQDNIGADYIKAQIYSCVQLLVIHYEMSTTITLKDKRVMKQMRAMFEKEPCVNYDPNIDTSFHSYYSCIPLENAMQLFREMAFNASLHIDSPDFINSTDLNSVVHMLFSHLYSPFDNLTQLIIEASENYNTSFNTLLLLFFLSSIILSISLFVIDMYQYTQLVRTFRYLLSVILRVPPIDIVENDFIVELLFDKATQKTSATSRVVLDFKYPIALLNTDFHFDTINSQFEDTFGYDISRIIGAELSFFINDTNFIKKLEKNLYHEVITEDLYCNKPDDTKIMCKVSIIPVFEECSNTISCYAMVISDLQYIEDKIKDIEELKLRNRKLLNALIPSVSEYSVDGYIENCAISVIKVICYGVSKSAALNAKRRQTIYKKFDEIIQQYQTLTNIINFNSYYVVIGFPRTVAVSQESTYIVDIINFSFSIGQLFEKSQVFGNFAIGIDQGGPLLASPTKGIRKKAVFSGEVFDNAEFLSNISSLGKILISERIYNLIATRDLLFEGYADEEHNYYYIKQKDN